MDRRPFEIFDELNLLDTNEERKEDTARIALSNIVVETKKVSQGGLITMGISPDGFARHFSGKTQLFLIAVDMEQYKAIEKATSRKEDDVKAWKAKAEKWDKLDKKIAAFYGHEDEKGNWIEKNNNEGGLDLIGEVAAAAFGWL